MCCKVLQVRLQRSLRELWGCIITQAYRAMVLAAALQRSIRELWGCISRLRLRRARLTWLQR